MFEALVTTLRDGDPKARRKAAMTLGNGYGTEAVEPLIAALEDPSARVAEEAAEALGRIGDTRAVPALIRALYHQNASARVGAVKGLADIGDPSTVGRLIQVLEADKDWLARRHAALALGKIGDPRAIPPLTAALGLASPGEGSHIRKALWLLEGEAIIPDLVAALDDYGETAKDALDTLVAIGSPVIAPLVDAIPGFNRLAALSNAAGVLAGLTPAPFGQLVEALDAGNGQVRRVAARALGMLKHGGAVAKLRDLLRDDPTARPDAAQALATIGGAGEDVLRIAAAHPDRDVRIAVTEAAPALDAAPASTGGTGLDDPDPGVRVATILAQNRAGRQIAPDLWLRLMSDDDAEVRSAAAAAAVRVWRYRTGSVLIRALADPSPKVRAAAAKALGSGRDEAAVSALIDRLGDDEDDVVFAAADALARIGDPSAIPALEEASSSIANGRLKSHLLDVTTRLRSVPAASLKVAHELPVDAQFGLHVVLPKQKLRQPEKVNLAAFAPVEVEPGVWRDLLCYVYLKSHASEVEADSMRRRDRDVEVRKSAGTARSAIARGTPITIFPRIPGLRVNPPHLAVTWEEDWHRADFRIMADPSSPHTHPDQALNGVVEYLVGGLLIGENPVSIFITSEANQNPETVRSGGPSVMYQSIFASYSRKDTPIVLMLGKAYKALGNTFLQDIEALRSGQDWRRELARLIDRADAFQLFWLEAASVSENVESEWREAISKRRPNFVRPVYWEKPLAAVPPDLKPLHFAFLPLGTGPIE